MLAVLYRRNIKFILLKKTGSLNPLMLMAKVATITKVVNENNIQLVLLVFFFQRYYFKPLKIVYL